MSKIKDLYISKPNSVDKDTHFLKPLYAWYGNLTNEFELVKTINTLSICKHAILMSR